MQTFLPYPDFKRSAQVLDRQRLGKQRVENLQLMTALTGVKRDKKTNKLVRIKPKAANPYQQGVDFDKRLPPSGSGLAESRYPPPRGIPWANHPAARMWRGYEAALLMYQQAICEEWTTRGYADTCFDTTNRIYRVAVKYEILPWVGLSEAPMPPWLGNKDFHKAHRSNLSRKNRLYYIQYWNTEPGLEYIWPTTKES